MLNLAIECSGQHGSVALCDENRARIVRPLPQDLGSVQSLAPTIESLLEPGQDVGLISVTVGPGSFTGLRVGLATAKMLAFAWNIPVVGVDTLDVIAERVFENLAMASSVGQPKHAEPSIVIPVINAYRQQVFSSAWLVGKGERPQRLAASQVVDAPLWISDALDALGCSSVKLQALRRVFAGPGLANYTPHGETSTLGDQADWSPRAELVGKLGWQAYETGAAVSARELLPNYVRPSAAEEARK